jgi:two-component system chemotaxis response regulator CheY
MKILIAEDQPPSALLLRRLLERRGNDVVMATDGATAWKVLQTSHVPVVITDWMMPRMDGLELCRRIRGSQIEDYIYVILLTSRDCREDRLVGLRAGADDFLIKPPDPDELAVRLEIAERILKVHETLRRQNTRLAELATTDELTGVKNRRRFREDLEMHVALAAREHLPLSLVMLDVDHFKSYNDAFGHPAGDEILRSLAAVLRQGVREHDTVARYGGEEFVVLLPATDQGAAVAVAERLRSVIERHSRTTRTVTASFGVATADAAARDAQVLVAEADEALYHAKRSGRNCVCHFRDAAPATPSLPAPAPGSAPRERMGSA